MSGQAVRVAMIGCGLRARDHAAQILRESETARVVVVCEPDPAAYQAMAGLFFEAGLVPPPNRPDLPQLLLTHGAELDVAFIATPHIYHCEQAEACLEAGLDVLLEKPMVVTADQAKRLIASRDRTGKLLVVAFDGSLSPEIRTAAKLLRSGELGDLLTISATVWQGWAASTKGHWKQDPAISGGGFMFDTGAHMLNTVAHLAGEDFTEVAAWLDNRGAPVDLLGVVMGRLASGALVTMNACGATTEGIGSEVRIHCSKGLLRTGIWGEFLEVQRPGESVPTPVGPSDGRGAREGVWQRFLEVRSGKIANPSPPEIGLRMAKVWDAIRLSAERDGMVVMIEEAT